MRRIPKSEAKLDPVTDTEADAALKAAEKIVGAKMTDPTEDEEKKQEVEKKIDELSQETNTMLDGQEW